VVLVNRFEWQGRVGRRMVRDPWPMRIALEAVITAARHGLVLVPGLWALTITGPVATIDLLLLG